MKSLCSSEPLVRGAIAVLWLTLQSNTAGCGGDDYALDQSAVSGDDDQDSGTNSDGCDAWRTASCAMFARCGQASSSCAAQYAAISCRSEESADRCAARMVHASCGAVASECQPLTIAETAPAIAGCKQYLQAACSSAMHCGFEDTTETCMAHAQVDCERAVGLTSSFAQCLAELSGLACGLWAPPATCAGAVVTH